MHTYMEQSKDSCTNIALELLCIDEVLRYCSSSLLFKTQEDCADLTGSVRKTKVLTTEIHAIAHLAVRKQKKHQSGLSWN